MARGVIVKMSYWDVSLIRPDGAVFEGNPLPFRWSDVRGTTTAQQFEVGKTIEYTLGRDRYFGTAKATNVRPEPA
jgi:hypothetical protein